jgi:Flp pilus assembly pilin Flp
VQRDEIPTRKESTGMNKSRRFFKSDEAIAVTEYGLLIALIAVVLIAAVLIFGTAISGWFGRKTGQITSN